MTRPLQLHRRMRSAQSYFSPAAIAAALLAGGCTVGPDYKQPKVESSPAFAEAGEGVSSRPAENSTWWTAFNDAQLVSLVDRAVAANLDLKLAEERVREARAARRVAAADEEPKVDATAGYTRQRIAGNRTAANIGGGSTFPSHESDLFQAGFDASWELDVFGRIRRNVEAAEAEIEASVEHKREVLVSLLGEVGRNYMELRGAQRERALTLQNLQSQEQSLELTRAKFNAGVVSEIDVARAQSLAATTRAQLPNYDVSEREAIHRLSVLTGQEPGALLAELTAAAPIPLPPADIAIGLPGELLKRRPDLRRAERELCAANARIGAAVAERYPRFSLLGSLGFGSSKIDTLPDHNSFGWSIGPSVRWPLLEGGRIEANIDIANSRTEQALIQLKQAFLTALQETEDSVVTYTREQARSSSLEQAVTASRRAMELANELYSKGLTDYLAVLEAQRSLLANEADLARSRTNVSLGAVALYKSLGGGW